MAPLGILIMDYPFITRRVATVELKNVVSHCFVAMWHEYSSLVTMWQEYQKNIRPSNAMWHEYWKISSLRFI